MDYSSITRQEACRRKVPSEDEKIRFHEQWATVETKRATTQQYDIRKEVFSN